MDQMTREKIFTYYPNTPEQDEDLNAIYREARCLAETITRCVDAKYADQALVQLTGLLSTCRQAVELSPRQAKPLVLV